MLTSLMFACRMFSLYVGWEAFHPLQVRRAHFPRKEMKEVCSNQPVQHALVIPCARSLSVLTRTHTKPTCKGRSGLCCKLCCRLRRTHLLSYMSKHCMPGQLCARARG